MSKKDRKRKPDRVVQRLLDLAKRDPNDDHAIQTRRRRTPQRRPSRVTQRLLDIAPKGVSGNIQTPQLKRSRWVQRLVDISAEQRTVRPRRMRSSYTRLRTVKTNRLIRELHARGYDVTRREMATAKVVQPATIIPQRTPRMRAVDGGLGTNKRIAEKHGVRLHTLYRLARRETQRLGKPVTIKDLANTGGNLRKLANAYRLHDMQKVKDATWRTPNFNPMDYPLTVEEMHEMGYLKEKYYDALERVADAKGIDLAEIDDGLDPEGAREIINSFWRSK